jgi:hypothetical protein
VVKCVEHLAFGAIARVGRGHFALQPVVEVTQRSERLQPRRRERRVISHEIAYPRNFAADG